MSSPIRTSQLVNVDIGRNHLVVAHLLGVNHENLLAAVLVGQI
jgi:hypothetical protein